MRDDRIDAAKGMLIILVVLGHFLEAMDGWTSPDLRAPLTAIYMMHMPAFIFLAGMTAKSHGVGRRIATYAVLLVLFQFAYLVPLYLTTGTLLPVLQPYWLLWFLLSLIFWTALLPTFLRLKHPLLIAVVLSLAIGLLPVNGYALSISRTFVLLPFFIAGHLYGPALFSALPKGWPGQAASIAILILATSALYSANLDRHWLYGSLTFEHLGVGSAQGITTRAILLLTSSIAMTCAFCLVSEARRFLPQIGRRSLGVFLLHGFAVILGRTLLALAHDHYGQPAALALMIVLTAITVAVLTLPIWDRWIRFTANAVIDTLSALLPAQKAKNE